MQTVSTKKVNQVKVNIGITETSQVICAANLMTSFYMMGKFPYESITSLNHSHLSGRQGGFFYFEILKNCCERLLE